MKFETLSSDFKKLIHQLNFSEKKLIHKNKSNRKPWDEYYEDIMKKIIHNLYFQDFKLFYEKDYEN
jgi:hypothetical protein